MFDPNSIFSLISKEFRWFENHIKRRKEIRLMRDLQNTSPCDEYNNLLDCTQYIVGWIFVYILNKTNALYNQFLSPEH